MGKEEKWQWAQKRKEDHKKNESRTDSDTDMQIVGNNAHGRWMWGTYKSCSFVLCNHLVFGTSMESHIKIGGNWVSCSTMAMTGRATKLTMMSTAQQAKMTMTMATAQRVTNKDDGIGRRWQQWRGETMRKSSHQLWRYGRCITHKSNSDSCPLHFYHFNV